MKKIYFMLLAIMAMSFTFTACSDQDPFSTATVNDDPRILDPIFPDRVNGALPVISNINRDGKLNIKLTVTPADYTTEDWLLDSVKVQTGTTIDTTLLAGTYNLKVIVSTTAGKSTSREGLVQVNPLDGDPYSAQVGYERIIAPGTTARLLGNNLNKVKSIAIGGKVITDINYVPNDKGNYIEYSVPADLTEGDYRVILVGNDNNQYGANTVKVSKAALITSGASRANAGMDCTISGINLDNIVSLTIGDQTITTFTSQSATSLTFLCPSLTDGDYTITGKTKGGTPVQFYGSNGISAQQTLTISSEITLWQGHHYVSWDLPDGDPHKTFNLIGQDVFAKIKAGSILRISYSIAPDAAYHKMGTDSGWWGDLPGTSQFEMSSDGVKEVVLTQAVLDMIQQQSGFLCVGSGYYVDRVSVQ
ncbi:hypothetical protein [Xylanibacter oryzae]|uniref:hypothetical protein n=1 Tax=Xylanibacter oryzae TaxID=185293 RepID=UPI0004BC988D|nr:hypothetical protein [Xylanibacter oryzae]